MRERAWIVAVLLVAPIAGCVGGGEESVDAASDPEASLPDSVHDERRVEAAASPAGGDRDQRCEAEASSCFSYPFTVAMDARVQAQLDWENATNDLDLHVFGPEGEPVASASTGPLDKRETLDAALEPGDYELVVVAWLATSDTYRLEAHFGYA
jgi:hypothetical protein